MDAATRLLPDSIESERIPIATLPAEEDLRRIERRQQARALDERELELRTFTEERAALTKHAGMDLVNPSTFRRRRLNSSPRC